MCGRCWGYGSTVHTRKKGNHGHDLCGYCKKVGHWETVCLDKFMAWERKQKAAATIEDSSLSMDFSLNLSDNESEDVNPAMLDMTTSTTLDDLKEQQKVLMEKIVALEKDFWRRCTQRPPCCCLRTYVLQVMIPHLVWPVITILTLALSLNWIYCLAHTGTLLHSTPFHARWHSMPTFLPFILLAIPPLLLLANEGRHTRQCFLPCSWSHLCYKEGWDGQGGVYGLRTGECDPGPPMVEEFEPMDWLGRGHDRGGAETREPKKYFQEECQDQTDFHQPCAVPLVVESKGSWQPIGVTLVHCRFHLLDWISRESREGKEEAYLQRNCTGRILAIRESILRSWIRAPLQTQTVQSCNRIKTWHSQNNLIKSVFHASKWTGGTQLVPGW